MSETTIRGGADAVAVEVSEHGVRIALGPGGVDASVVLDFGEARLLAETILADLEVLLEVVLEVAAQRDDVSLPLAGIPDGVWRVVQDEDQISFEKLSRRERDLVVLRNPSLWPLSDRLFVKRWILEAPYQGGGRMETGFLRQDRGAVIWEGADLVASYESFEALVLEYVEVE